MSPSLLSVSKKVCRRRTPKSRDKQALESAEKEIEKVRAQNLAFVLFFMAVKYSPSVYQLQNEGQRCPLRDIRVFEDRLGDISVLFLRHVTERRSSRLQEGDARVTFLDKETVRGRLNLRR